MAGMFIDIDHSGKIPTIPPVTHDKWNAKDWEKEADKIRPNWQSYVISIGDTDVCGVVRNGC